MYFQFSTLFHAFSNWSVERKVCWVSSMGGGHLLFLKADRAMCIGHGHRVCRRTNCLINESKS